MGNVADWRQNLTFLNTSGVEHTVNGQVLKFYPISVGTIFEARQILVPLVKAIATFFVSSDKDQKYTDTTTTDKDGATQRVVETSLSPEMALYRDDQKMRAWKEASEFILKEENKAVIGKILMDSLQEQFPRDGNGRLPETPKPEAFAAAIPAPILPAMLKGMFNANKDVFGFLGDQAKSIFDSVESNLRLKVAPDAEAKSVSTPG